MAASETVRTGMRHPEETGVGGFVFYRTLNIIICP